MCHQKNVEKEVNSVKIRRTFDEINKDTILFRSSSSYSSLWLFQR